MSGKRILAGLSDVAVIIPDCQDFIESSCLVEEGLCGRSVLSDIAQRPRNRCRTSCMTSSVEMLPMQARVPILQE